MLGLHLATGRGPALQPDFSVDAGQRLDRDSAVAGVITGSEPSWIAPFAGLSPRVLGKPVTALRREGVDPVRNSRPWSLPLDDRVLLVVTYWRTNLTLRQHNPLFGISKSAADRIIDHLGPLLALQPRRGSARTLCSSWTAPLRPPASEATLPVPRSPDPGRAGQHDLEIVIALCQSFEMRREPTGKRIKPPSHSPTAPSEAQQAKSSDRIPPHPPVGCPGDLARQVVVEADDHLQRGERLVLAVDRPQRVRHFEDRSSLAFRSTSAADWPA